MGRSGNGGGVAASTLNRLAMLADPRRNAPVAVRQVSNRVGIFNQKSGSNTRSGWRSWQVAYVPLTAIQIGLWNGYSSSALSGVETGCGGPLTATLSVEYPLGTFTRLTWGGASSGVIADNATRMTDMVALPVAIPAFAKFRIAGDFQYLSGGTVPSCGWSNSCDRGMGDEYQVATTADYTMTGTVLGTGLTNAVFPQLVLGASTRPVWGLIGDSITAGVNDTVFDPGGGRGLVGRAMAEAGPHLNYGLVGDRASWYLANSTRRRALMTSGGITAAVLALGVNDITSGRTPAQLAADRAAIRALLPAVSCVETTLPPVTSSTDAWRTAANQTASATTANRVAFNAALRGGGAAGVAGILDVSALLETSTSVERGPVLDGGVWLPDYMTGSDGTHPNSMGMLAVKPLVQSALALLR